MDPFGLASSLEECLKRCATDFWGIPIILGILGMTLYVLGKPWIGTRGKFAGSTPGTSPASKYLRNWFSGRFKKPKAVPDFRNIGRFLTGKELIQTPYVGAWLGRMVPVAGWVLLAVDVVYMLACVVN
jgi:hypothetical protein